MPMEMKVFELIITNFDKILSWPLAILIIFVVFQKPLFKLLGNLQRIEVGNDKGNIKALFGKLKEESNAIASPNQPSDISTTKPVEIVSFQQQIELLTDISPPAAIIFAYSQLVNKCSRLNEDFNNWKADQNFINEIISWLYEDNKMSKEEFTLFTTMKAINDSVLYSKDTQHKIDKQLAIEYGKTTEILMDRISFFAMEEK